MVATFLTSSLLTLLIPLGLLIGIGLYWWYAAGQQDEF